MDFRCLVRVLIAFGLILHTTAATAGKKDNSIRFAYEQIIENIDPYFNSVRGGVILGYQIWDNLIYRDPRTNEYKGQLATTWRWVDERTLELELRKGVKFHNGADFDADDVVYTLNFVAKPENKVTNQQVISWIERVEKLDQYKVRIVAKEPFPAALEYLASARLVIHPHEYYARVGPKGMNEKPIGSGPYRVTEHLIGKHVRLARNPDYFRDSPRPGATVEKVEIRFIPDRQTQVAEVFAGGIDMMINIPADQAQQMRGAGNVQVVFGDTMRIMFLQLATSERAAASPLRDVRVRKAILHSIDRPAMIKSIVGEGATLLHSVCYPSQFGCTDEGVAQFEYDPRKAKALLAEAGLANGFDIDIYAYRERTHVEAIIGYLRAVGIRANLRFLQYAALRDAVRTGQVALAFQSWGSTSINDVSACTSVFYKGNPDDMNHDGEVQSLLQRGDTSVEPSVRKNAYATALALIQERAYALPLYSLPMYYIAAKDLVFTPHADEVPRFWEMSYK